jgi:hypothetical protein
MIKSLLTRAGVAVGSLALSLTAGVGSRPQIPIRVASTRPALTRSLSRR